MADTRRVAVPVGVTVDPDSLALRGDELDESLRMCTTRALRDAKKVAALTGGDHALVRLDVKWQGIALASVPAGDRAHAEARIRTVLRGVAKAEGLTDQTRRDPFARAPLEPEAGAEPAPAEPIDVATMLDRLRGPDLTDRGIAMLELYSRVVAGDEEAVYLALMAIQPDDSTPTGVAIPALRELWEKDPDRFRQVLAQLGLVPATSLVERTDCDFKVDEGVRTAYGPLLGAIARLARELPEAGIGPSESGIGVEQVLALLDVWRQAWSELAAHLRSSKETTDARHLANVAERAQNIQSLMGILAAYSSDWRIKRLIPDLGTDLQEAIRWTFTAAAGLQQIEALLAVYRESFGPVAATQEEVQVLLETRTALIRGLVDCPLPRGKVARTVQDELAVGLANWRIRAADRRIQRLRKGIAQLTTFVGSLKEPNPYYERMLEWEPWTDVRAPYVGRLYRTRLDMADLAAQLNLAAEHPTELEPLLAIETKLALESVRIPILSRFAASLELQKHMFQGVGWASERRKWTEVINRMRKAMAAAYDKPDLATIERDLEWWQWDLEEIEHELVMAGRREFAIDIAINIAAMLITAKVAGVGGSGAALTRVTLAEAVTFTAITSVGRAVLLNRPMDPTSFLNETIDNFAMFGAFKILGIVLEAGAVPLLRGRPVAQLTAILGLNTVITTGLPVLVMRFQAAMDAKPGTPARAWGEPEASAIATGLILNGVMAAIGGRQMLTRLQAINANELRLEIASLNRENAAWATEFRAMLDQGTPPPSQFNALRRQGVALLRRTQKALRLLADLPHDFYPDVGTPTTLLNEADNLGDWARRFESMEYHPPPEGRLLPPGQIVPGAIVPIGSGLSGYRPGPGRTAPPALVDALRKAGYTVRNDAGVLLLTAGEGPVLHRLLPAPALEPVPKLSREAAEGQAVILSASGLGRPAVEKLLETPRGEEAFSLGEAMTTAAQLEPELMRQAILAEGAEAKVRLAKLSRALTDVGLPASMIDLVDQGVQAVASARRTAEIGAPREDLVAAAGGSLRAREILAGVDGQALLEGSRRAPAKTRAVLMGAEAQVEALKAEAVSAWKAEGMAADRVEAASHALDALLEVKNRPPTTAAEALDAAVGTEARDSGILKKLQAEDPDAYAALLKAAEEERELVVRVARASEERTRTDALSELARRLQREGVPVERIRVVGDTLTKLNEVRRRWTLWAEEQQVRAQRVSELLDDDAFRRDAEVVIQRFRSPRQERARAWLDTRIGSGHTEVSDTWYLAQEVDRSPILQKLAAQGGGTMLRQLWTMYRAGRARAAKVQFAEYVDILQRIHRGLAGEYAFTFWVGDKYVVLKAPDANVTLPGTDIILVRRGGGPPIWVDQKALSAEVLYKISALTRNLPTNVANDLDLFESLLTSGHEYPPELLSAMKLQEQALVEIRKVVKGLNKDQIEAPAIQKKIANVLKKFGIQRVAGVEGGQVRELGTDLKNADFTIFEKDE